MKQLLNLVCVYTTSHLRPITKWEGGNSHYLIQNVPLDRDCLKEIKTCHLLYVRIIVMKNLRWSCSMPFDSKHRHHVFLSEVQENPTDKAKVGKRGNVSITPVTNFVHLPCII